MKSKDARRILLEWFQTRSPLDQTQVGDKLLEEYWDRAEKIIAKFNEFGGGPEEQEERAYAWLEKISELRKNGQLSADARLDFIDEAFSEYDKENSGFEDTLMNLFAWVVDAWLKGVSAYTLVFRGCQTRPRCSAAPAPDQTMAPVPLPRCHHQTPLTFLRPPCKPVAFYRIPPCPLKVTCGWLRSMLLLYRSPVFDQ